MNLNGLPFPDRLARALPYLATALIVIGFVNFFWFIAEAVSVGTADQGRIVDGHFFLGNKGTYTEVDQAAWEWSQFHGASILVTHPLALASMAFLTLRRAFPARMAGTIAADPDLARRRIDLVRDSGPLMARDSMGGRIGPIMMTAPLLEVSVHPKGLLVHAKLMNEHAILAEEILHVHERRIFLQHGVEIAHLGMGSKPPLLLYRSMTDPIVVAINDMVANRGVGLSQQVVADASSTSWPPLPSSEPAERGSPRDELLPAVIRQGRLSLADQPAVPGLEPRWLGTTLELVGLGVGIALVTTGLLWAIPKLGGFGILWTVGAVAILAWNGTNVVRRHLIPPPRESGDAATSDHEPER